MAFDKFSFIKSLSAARAYIVEQDAEIERLKRQLDHANRRLDAKAKRKSSFAALQQRMEEEREKRERDAAAELANAYCELKTLRAKVASMPTWPDEGEHLPAKGKA